MCINYLRGILTRESLSLISIDFSNKIYEVLPEKLYKVSCDSKNNLKKK